VRDRAGQWERPTSKAGRSGAYLRPLNVVWLRSLGNSRRYLLVLFLAGLGGASLAFIWPAKYSAEVLLLVDKSSDASSLLSLAADQGLPVQGLLGSSGSANNGYAYVELLHSRTLLESVLRAPLPNAKGATYLDEFAPATRDSSERMALGVQKLRRSISARFDLRSGTITMLLKGRDRHTTEQIANLLVSSLAEFNIGVRATNARNTSSFIDERLVDSKRSLADSEARLAAFDEANAHIGNSPGLQLQLKRLERDVRLNEGTFELLSRQLELARIQEKREAPVFTVVDTGLVSQKPGKISPWVGAIVGVIFAGIALFLLEAFQHLAAVETGERMSA
jgi:uncharacterized protein involved in exopolysaccharide biosynthesis